MIKSFKTEIPESQSEKEWIDYSYGGKKFYVKVPQTTSGEIYRNEIRTKLKNKHRTFIPVVINSIRVIDEKTDLTDLVYKSCYENYKLKFKEGELYSDGKWTKT